MQEGSTRGLESGTSGTAILGSSQTKLELVNIYKMRHGKRSD